MFGLFKPRKLNIPNIAEIRMYYGLPRSGKTYMATDDVIRALRKNNGVRVYTNWPVFDKKSGRYTYKITRDDFTKIDRDADVYIDESHFWFNSRLSLVKGRGLTEDEMTWFRTHGHRNIRVTLITHHPDRVDVIIRNIVHVFIEVSKKSIPFTSRPLQFNLKYYLSESDMVGLIPKPADQKIVFFSKGTANAYDTHFFSHLFEKEYDFPTWAPSDPARADDPGPDQKV